MTILACVALLLPGLAWWAWLGRRDQDPLISLAGIVGFSFSFIALMAESVFLLGGRFTPLNIGFFLAVLALQAVLGLIKRGVGLPKKYYPHLWIGLIVLGMVIVWRLYQARQLLLPNWVDAQHHFLIIRAILENGGLPQTLSPYLEVPFYYHYGFHVITVLFSALSGLSIGSAMLTLGQVLNALIGLSVYVLGKALFKDWRPAAAAGLLVSFATRMPAYYLSWGRYTLTTGLILLPLVMALALRMLYHAPRKGDWITLALLTAGVLLSHYFTAVLLAIFLVLLALAYLIPRWKAPLTALIGFSGVTKGVFLGLLLAAPWLIRVARFASASTGVSLDLPESISYVINESGRWNYIWQLLGPVSNHWLLLAAGVGLILTLVLSKSTAFALWSLLLPLMALPSGLRLQPFRDDHFAIILFLPVVLWVGWLFWWVGGWLEKRLKRRWVSVAILGLIVVGWSAWGFSLSQDIVNSRTVLITDDDLDALEWVKENTPEEARFFINTTHWLGGVYRGLDGGGWLLPYTGRWSIVPTVFYGFSPDREYKQQIQDWGERASQVKTCSEEFWVLVAEAELDWIYLREGKGALQPKGLEGCEGLREMYANGRVYIYAIGQ